MDYIRQSLPSFIKVWYLIYNSNIVKKMQFNFYLSF